MTPAQQATDATDTQKPEKPWEETFEALWKLYPEKKGKGKIKTDRKKQLHKIGYNHMARAIERYKKDVQQKRATGFSLAYQYGSTFFTSGYHDYLDDAYDTTQQEQTAQGTAQHHQHHRQPRKTGFHLPPETSRSGQYTNEQLEKMLLKRNR